MSLSQWCSSIIRWTFYSLFVIVPIILTPINYELFEYNKMMVTYAVTAIVFSAWIIKGLADRTFAFRRTPLDIPIIAFLVSQLVSSWFSIDPHVSWFGYYSRFNGGMWSLLCYAVLYWAFVTILGQDEASAVQSTHVKKIQTPIGTRSSTHVTYTLKFIIWTAVAVAFYGFLERLGIDKSIWVQDVQSRVFSTLGQPNWLAAYLIALVPIIQAFGIRSYLRDTIKTTTKATFPISFYTLVWIILSWFFFAVIIFTRSRSGLVALILSESVFWVYIFIQQKLQKAGGIVLGSFIALSAVFIFFHGSNVSQIDNYVSLAGIGRMVASKQVQTTPQTSTPTDTQPLPQPGSEGSALLDGGVSGSDVIRGFVWQAAIGAWKETTKTILIGTGTETFAFAFFQHKPARHNLTSEWDFLYNKAHNEYLNFLTTTGAFGISSYMAIIFTFILWYLWHIGTRKNTDYSSLVNAQTSELPKSVQNVPQPLQPKDVQLLLLDAHSTHILEIALVAGWLSILVTNFFGFSVVIVQLFLFLFPAMIFILAHKPNSDAPHKKVITVRIPNFIVPIMYICTILFGTGSLFALVITWHADTMFASGYRYNRNGQYAQAQLQISDALAYSPFEPLYYDELATSYAGLTSIALQNRNATDAAKLLELAVASSDKALSISPKNVNFWKTRTKVYYAVAEANPTYFANSIDALEQGYKLSPTDPKILYNLAVLEGRRSNSQKAIDYLNQAITLKANYKDAYYALYLFLDEAKQTAEGKAVLNKYLTTIDPNDAQFKALMAKQ